MASSSRIKRWLLVVAVLVLILLGLRLGRNVIFDRALREVARQAEGSNYAIDFQSVNVSLFSGNISLKDLVLRPLAEPAANDSGPLYAARAGEVELLGVEIWSLLKNKRLYVRSVRIRSPEIEHSFVPRKQAKAEVTENEPAAKGEGLGLVQIDSLVIEGARGSMRDRTKDQPTMSVKSLDLMMAGIKVTQDASGKTQFGLNAARLNMVDMESHMAPFYTLRIDSMRVQVPRDSSVIFGIHMIPEVSPNDYHKQVKYQSELYTLDLDTVLLSGFDLAAKLEQGILRADGLYVSGANFSIHRDKSIPMPPTGKRKPLLSEKIKRLPFPLSLGVVELHRSSVTYHERLKRGDPYGSIAFTSINGTLKGLDNIHVGDSSGIHLDGSAAMGTSKVRLDLRMPVVNGISRVSAHVELEDLPAQEINRMTSDLLHVKAISGRIQSVDMRFEGDDIRASGTVDLRYQDLELELSPAIKHAGVISFAANAVVRSSNMPGEKKYKVGHFKVERQQESAVFNYLWIALREGMMDVVLPPMVTKKIQKMQAERKKS